MAGAAGAKAGSIRHDEPDADTDRVV